MFLSELIYFAKVWVPGIRLVFFFYFHDYDSHLFKNHGWVAGASTSFSTQKLWGDESVQLRKEKSQFHQSQRQLVKVNSVISIMP